MRILSWIQGKKPNGRKESKRASNSTRDGTVQETQQQKVSTQSHGLLAIGTFGDENLNQVKQKRFQGNPSSPSSLEHHLQDLTPEELRELQKEFDLLLDEQLKQPSSSLESEESKTTKNESDYDEMNEKIETFKQIILSRRKDFHKQSNDTAAIGKRSLFFLLKQIFVCKGGIPPATVAHPLRIQVPESRMEKMLRTVLNKKIYPQSSNVRTSSMKKYLRKRNVQENEDEDGKNGKKGNGSKWVQTDSEYIVLEI